MVKQKFKGIFNLNRETFILYAWAHSKAQAEVQMMRRIAKKQGVIPSWTFNYFKDHDKSFDVVKEAP